MIEIYLKTNTNYDKNGDITLNPSSCTYKDSENLLTLEHFIDDEARWKYINFENVIATEENGKKKLYRIYNVVKELYSITAYARPIFFDLIDKVLLDVRPTYKTGEEALNILLEGTGYTGHSNITMLNTSYYIRKNIVEALIGDIDNSFLKRWGGEFYCENFDVYINDKIGSDNGVRVEFGYNLNEIEEDINIEEVVTRIIPVGYDGIMLEGNAPWVDSPLINKYTQPKMRVIEFSDVKVKENSDDKEGFDTIEEARAELIRQCNLLYENDIDKPTVNYKIDMINLTNTTAYKDFKMLVEVNKGDTVTCYIKHLDIDVKARVIDYERDLITGEYIYIELGNVVSNFFNEQADIQGKVNSILNSNGSVKAQTVEGTINAVRTQFKALRDVAQQQNVRAILFEDKLEDSPTFGCMCLGTMGFEIASTFKPGTKEWDFRTFGTGKGFFADYIVAGTMLADRIKSGLLMSLNEKTWIDMDNGTFNFGDLLQFDGNEMRMKDTGFKIANSDNNIIAYIGQDNWMRLQGLEIFGIGECMQNKGAGTRSLKLITTDGGATHIDFNGNPYDDYTVRIIREAGSEYLKMLTKGLEVQSFTPNTPCGLEVRSHGNSAYLDFSYNAIDDYNVRLIVHNNDRNLHCHGDGLIVHGNLQITGNKNCIQNTKNYGQVAFYAVEDCESYFTDRSMELFTVEETEEGTYERVILLDNVFKEAVNLKKYSYTIEIVKQSWGDYRIKEQTSNYFIVESDRKDFTFKYAVIAKRKGYENVRLEEYFYNESEVINEH